MYTQYRFTCYTGAGYTKLFHLFRQHALHFWKWCQASLWLWFVLRQTWSAVHLHKKSSIYRNIYCHVCYLQKIKIKINKYKVLRINLSLFWPAAGILSLITFFSGKKSYWLFIWLKIIWWCLELELLFYHVKCSLMWSETSGVCWKKKEEHWHPSSTSLATRPTPSFTSQWQIFTGFTVESKNQSVWSWARHSTIVLFPHCSLLCVSAGWTVSSKPFRPLKPRV